MKYIREYKEGDRVLDIYLCKHKQQAVTRNGKPYENIILQDKTGTMDAKVWDPNSAGIEEFSALDYIEVHGEVTSFQGALQVNAKRIRRCHSGEYTPENYVPVSSHDADAMYKELLSFVNSVQNQYLHQLLEEIFVNDAEFAKAFSQSSAAKSVHHGFVGGLLEHTLSVAKLCSHYCTAYGKLNKDLLITAALCHDIGKTKELSLFPENDYTDAGQLLGHIIIGTEMVGRTISRINGFPAVLEGELKHCILSHHGELEYGSPKKPALIEAAALYFADNTDAKLQMFTELLDNSDNSDWLGYQKWFETNVRRTIV